MFPLANIHFFRQKEAWFGWRDLPRQDFYATIFCRSFWDTRLDSNPLRVIKKMIDLYEILQISSGGSKKL
jgi:hypothetical protein